MIGIYLLPPDRLPASSFSWPVSSFILSAAHLSVGNAPGLQVERGSSLIVLGVHALMNALLGHVSKASHWQDNIQRIVQQFSSLVMICLATGRSQLSIHPFTGYVFLLRRDDVLKSPRTRLRGMHGEGWVGLVDSIPMHLQLSEAANAAIHLEAKIARHSLSVFDRGGKSSLMSLWACTFEAVFYLFDSIKKRF